MRKTFYKLLFLSLLSGPAAAAPLPNDDCVVFIHGLARTSSTFAFMEPTFKKLGYATHLIDYPSTKHDLNTLTQSAFKDLPSCKGQMHFVTHSMGGILVRKWLSTHQPDNLGRVVMLAPPNQGSEIIDTFQDQKWFQMLNGPASLELSTDPNSTPNSLGPVDFPLGVIAGTQTVNPILSSFIPGPDDGKVSVQRSKVEGMSDHIVLPGTHTFLMNNPLVQFQTYHFLQNGKFDKSATFQDGFRKVSEIYLP